MSRCDPTDPGDPYSSSDAGDYDAEDIEQHFAELCETESASEASALAARLRRCGIIALANAEPYAASPDAPSWARQQYRTFVMVFASDLERAIEIFNDELQDEGDASMHAIARDIQDAAENPEDAMAWYYRDEQARQHRSEWRNRILFAALLAFAAWFVLS